MAAVLIKFFSLGVKTMAKPLAKRFEVPSAARLSTHSQQRL